MFGLSETRTKCQSTDLQLFKFDFCKTLENDGDVLDGEYVEAQVDYWQKMQSDAPAGFCVVRDAQSALDDFIGRHIMYRFDDESEYVWRHGTVSIAGTEP